MKIKTILITLLVVGGIGAGSVYGAIRYTAAHRKKVQVAPVSAVSTTGDFYYDEDEETITGNILATNLQSVELNSEYDLTKVYVKAGDTVKVGDPLLEYDMTKEQLEREMEELKSQINDMTLSSQEKYLEKLLKNPDEAMSKSNSGSGYGDDIDDRDDAGVDTDDDDDRTESADIEFDEDTVQDAAPRAEDAEGGDEEDPIDDDISGDPSDDPEGEDIGDGLDEGEEGQSEDEGDQTLDEIDNDELFDDEELSYPDGDEEFDIFDNDTTEDDDAAEYKFDYEKFALSEALTEFKTLADLLSMQYEEEGTPEEGNVVRNTSEIVEENLSDALDIFMNKLSAVPDSENDTIQEFTDALGETRKEKCYVLSDEVKALLKEMQETEEAEEMVAPLNAKDVEVTLYKTFINLLYYDLACKMNKLNEIMASAGVNEDTVDTAFVTQYKEQIMDAVNAYYRLDVNWKLISQILEDPDQYGLSQEEVDELDRTYRDLLRLASGDNEELSDETDGILSKLIALLNHTETVEDPEPETQPIVDTPPTEPPQNSHDYDDYDDDDGYDSDEPDYTKEELEDAIRDAEDAIKETKLTIRENELKLKQLDRKLSGKIVRATIDGTIKNAGEVGKPNADDYFIVVTGAMGMYVQGTVGELKLDTLKIGDTLTGTSDDTGETFTARVTEISTYPSEGEQNNYSWFYGTSGNSNVSQYPFTAYIEDDIDLTEGTVTMQFTNRKQSTGIYLENAFILEDAEGKNYVLIRGEDGLLKKQIIKTGKTIWDYYTEIVSGLKESDYIAIPYGRGVEPGAPTTEVEYFDEL